MGAGRPVKPIDWEKVKDLAMAGCSGTEICSHFDMHYDTFYRRVQQDQGVKFTEFIGEYSEKGKSLIRVQQFAKALGRTDKGDNTLLIWLGKQRLKQTDFKAKDIEVSVDKYLDRIKTRDFSKDDYQPIKPSCNGKKTCDGGTDSGNDGVAVGPSD